MKSILVSTVTRDINRGQRILLAKGDFIHPNISQKFQRNFYELMTSKLIHTINRINYDPANVSKLPKGLSSDVYLLGAFCYYNYDQSPIEDGVFDALAKHLLKIGWDAPIQRSDLEAGTFIGKYPTFIEIVADKLELSNESN